MSLERISNFDINKVTPKTDSTVTGGLREKSGGPSFAEALGKLQGQDTQKASGVGAVATSDLVKFSNHAIDRIQSRGIKFSPEQLGRLQKGVEKAAAKGSQNSLVLVDDTAMIVSVKNNTVVTVMDKSMLKENVFTNIDSTVVM